jgi:hypothetical protein
VEFIVSRYPPGPTRGIRIRRGRAGRVRTKQDRVCETPAVRTVKIYAMQGGMGSRLLMMMPFICSYRNKNAFVLARWCRWASRENWLSRSFALRSQV